MHRALIGLTWFVAACASSSKIVFPSDFPKAHRVLQLVDGGSWSSEFRYTLADADLVIQHRHPRERFGGSVLELAVHDHVRLDATTAKAMWDAIERLGVSRWRARYHPDDLHGQAFDGTKWSVVLRVDGVERETWGFNVYPALDPLGEPSWEHDGRGRSVPTAYSELLALFRRFDKRANKALEPTTTSVTSPAAQEPRQP